jgi:hypothetical protein
LDCCRIGLWWHLTQPEFQENTKPHSFHDRSLAFEAKYAHDQEFEFRVEGRRDTLFALWAASKRRLSAAQTASLSERVMAVRGGLGHDESVLSLVQATLGRHGGIALPDLARGLMVCADEARQYLLKQPGNDLGRVH